MLSEKWPALYAGLNQMPTESVRRALRQMRRKDSRVIYSGEIVLEDRY